MHLISAVYCVCYVPANLVNHRLWGVSCRYKGACMVSSDGDSQNARLHKPMGAYCHSTKHQLLKRCPPNDSVH